MKNKRTGPEMPDKIKIQMTPLIDLAFQLLAFFVLSYKVAAMEGDFDIKMPLGSAAGMSTDFETTVPMSIRLVADAKGNIADIRVNEERSFQSFDDLHRHIIATVGTEGGPTGEGSGQEATIDADYSLKWSETIAAITAISGYVVDNRGRKDVVTLIQNIKFKPPAQRTGG